MQEKDLQIQNSLGTFFTIRHTTKAGLAGAGKGGLLGLTWYILYYQLLEM